MTLVTKIVDTDAEEPKGPKIEVLDSLKDALREQLKAVIDQPFTSTHLRRLSRLCHSMADAMASLERPEKLLRNRFGGYLMPNVGYGESYGDEEAIASAPNIETYGANAQRELMASIGQIAKSLMPKPAQPSVIDLVTAIGLAKVRKDKAVEKMLRKKLDKMMADEPEAVPELPALPPDPPPRSKKVQATVVAQGGAS